MNVEDLRKSRDTGVCCFSGISTVNKRPSAIPILFFEGKDNGYYVPRIKQFTTAYRPINCGGRKAILDVYRLITKKEEYKSYKLGFFIDRDFNRPIERRDPPVFETPCYAIENLYVSITVFKEILTNVFYLDDGLDDEFAVLSNLYEQRQNEFHQAVLLFNAWLACLIDRKNKEGIEIGVKLETKLPTGFVDICMDGVSKNYDLKTIEETFPTAIKVDVNEVERKMQSFERSSMHKEFRGKYELEFLITMIRLILNKNKKIKFAFGDASSVGQEQALLIFSGYAETPKSLLDYLQEVV